jgi:ATP-binding cassette subfamily F protein 3
VLVSLSNATFGYTADPILREVTFQVNPKEKLGVVGPNGHGKSTLLRLIAGQLLPESGERSQRRGVEVGYLRQSQEFPDDVTVHDLLMGTFPEVLATERQLEAVQERMAAGDDSERTLAEFGELQHAFEEMDGYSLESRAAALAHEVGFSDEDLVRPAGSLSGGERARFELARVLLRQPELLLLDEPTNHLDLVQLERLEKRLQEYPNAFLLVSHDRAFLRATCEGIVEVERKGIVRYPGGWDAYKRQREQRLRRALDEYVQQQEKIDRTEDFIRRNIAGQKTKQAQARRKMLEKLERVERPEDIWEAAKHLGIDFETGEHPGGREAVRAKGLAVGFPGVPPLVSGFDWTLHRGERIGIVGPNGAGKTTLLRTLLGRQAPLDGIAELGYQVRAGYLDQKLVDGLDLSLSLVDEVRTIRPDLTIDGARSELARYRFFGDDVFKVVGALSGGERCRLALLKVSLKPHNLLVLDEPTNHLDIPSCEVLERALEEYEGTLIVISHDRDFLDRVVARILWVEGGRARVIEGNYSEARRRMRGEREAEAGKAGAAGSVVAPGAAPGAAPGPAPAPAPRPAPRPSGKARKKKGRDEPGTRDGKSAKGVEGPAAGAEPVPKGKRDREHARRRRAEKQKARNRVSRLETEIEQFEARLSELETELGKDPDGDWERLNRLANEEQELRARLGRRYAEWERVAKVLEEED